jgi:hypothetical protein
MAGMSLLHINLLTIVLKVYLRRWEGCKVPACTSYAHPFGISVASAF